MDSVAEGAAREGMWARCERDPDVSQPPGDVQYYLQAGHDTNPLQAIESNDNAVKAELVGKFDVLEKGTTKTTAEIQAAMIVAQATTSALAKSTEDKVANEIDNLKNAINAQSNRVASIESDGPIVTNRLAQAEAMVQELR